MKFKAPKGDIFGWSIFWFVCGLFLAVVAPFRGETTLVVLGVFLAGTTALIWFDQKWVAPLLMIFFALGGLGRLVAMFTEGFTLYSLIRLLMPGFFVYILWEWYRSDSIAGQGVTMQLEDLGDQPHAEKRRDPFSTTSPFDTPPDDDRLSNPYLENRPDER